MNQSLAPAAHPWQPDARAFLLDLEAKPESLERLAGSPQVQDVIGAFGRVSGPILFLGMGSSKYAADVAAAWLRGRGIEAISEYASARLTPPATPDRLVVAISASGESKETLEALSRYQGTSRTLAITGDAGSHIARLADAVLLLEAGPEAGGVACRSFQHTGLLLRALGARWAGVVLDFAGLCGRVAEASSDLLERRPRWLEPVAELLDGPDGIHVVAPAERWSSAAQSALMFREGPRRPATASETGDWNHVDVYLTRSTDYRALLLTGSPYDEDAMRWLRQRRSTIVTVGGVLPGAHHRIDYRGVDDEDIALHTETLVSELVAARWWLADASAEKQ
jgi:glutamine---fructose-6-phosphate transaminase (isomerizing)